MKKITFLFIFFFILSLSNVYGADGDLIWERRYDNLRIDVGYSVAVDSNNNVIVTGKSQSTSSPFNHCYYTIKYDSNGNLIWGKRFGNFNSNRAYGVAVDSNNNIIVTGYIRDGSSDTTKDYYTIKYDPLGNVIWERRYDRGREDHPYAVAVDTNNNVIVTGSSINSSDNPDYYTIKYSENGTVLWEKAYDSGRYDYASGVAVDSNNNVIITGRSQFTSTTYNYLTLKYGPDGTLIGGPWTYSAGTINRASSVAVDLNNNIIVTGFRRLSSNDTVYTIKYTPTGSVIWSNYFNKVGSRPSNELLEINDVTVDSLNNVIVTGSVNNGVNWDYYTVKYDPLGNVLWQRTYNGGNEDYAHGVAKDSLNNILVVGRSMGSNDYDYYLIKYEGIPGRLQSSISATPATVTPGQTITVSMTVNNTGGETVNNVAPSSLTLGGTSSAALSTGPSPASANIAAGGSQTFSWTYTAGSAGTVNFAGNATGTGAVSGNSFSSASTTSTDVTILAKNPLPEPILFPGVSIQQLTMVSSGASVIHDGKAITALEVAPGTQDILIEVKNKSFLTQIDVGVMLEGLPYGVSYTVGPQLKKVNAHNTVTFTVTLTISPEVPEGTYQIKTTTYSRKGPRDRIDLTLVIK
ncbi:MAG: Beta-propeller repeat protein [Candidatus Methanofastidiosum methylothiophilum]|uniref:Beta-propeller repeat protein n=1 Tax=Candidatus Methanofastidiosum methylothiophilum TaxID=1705564 RepID=A0A150JI39_9EURY|nr:MAG: Beta-propeller repeat protein [Candidatus Methanofastidiosum methylthiophilus]KYC58642.1 MAG: Beta-propeller repeat protein [Candidatus Methanofastidiosum methylthiophilus]